jgi:hypothetical protein
MARYIPDVSRALSGVLSQMKKRAHSAIDPGESGPTSLWIASPAKSRPSPPPLFPNRGRPNVE